MKKIAVGDLGEFWYGDYKEPFEQLEGGVPGHPKGVVLKDDDGKVMCAFDGKTFDNLGQHVRHKHGMHAADYKREVGLLQKSALVSERVRQAQSRGSLLRMRKNPAMPFKPGWNRGTKVAAKQETRWTPEFLNKTGTCYQQVLATGRAVLREHGRITSPLMKARGIYETRIVAYFGTWQKFAELVGAPPMRRVFSDAQMLDALRNLATQLGRTPSQSDMRRYGLPSSDAYRDHFGSFSEACRKAGLDPNLPMVADEEETIRALVAYATTGSFKAAARATTIGSPQIASIFARYGCPYPSTGGNHEVHQMRREWAADMARRLAGTEEVAA
jgi:hypothetical protein